MSRRGLLPSIEVASKVIPHVPLKKLGYCSRTLVEYEWVTEVEPYIRLANSTRSESPLRVFSIVSFEQHRVQRLAVSESI
jgi:hypothetical protein